jgi:ribosome-binding factor A
VPLHGRREPRFPRAGDVRREDEADPRVFFGETERSRRRIWKVRQLCKQVERAAASTLSGECGSEVLLGAAVVSAEPAPDAARLRVLVLLAPGKGVEDAELALASLRLAAPAFRQEIARSIHRKRVPEIAFDVILAAEMGNE